MVNFPQLGGEDVNKWLVTSHNWDYFKFPKCITPEMVPNGNNLYEFVMVARFVPLLSCHRSHLRMTEK